MIPGFSLWSRIRDGIGWRIRLWRRRQFLLNKFQNGPELVKSLQEKLPCELAICMDGTRLTHPAERTGFVSTLVEVWYDQVYLPDSFYCPADNDVVIDAGANVGLFTIWLARLCPNCQILAFEPFAENYKHLRANLDAAKVARVKTYQQALGASSGRGSMMRVGSRSLDHRLSTKGNGPDKGQEIAVITLGELLDLAEVERIALLKMDIEGAEYEIFESIDEKHLARIDRLAIEYHEHLRTGTLELLEKKLAPTHHLSIERDRSGMYGMIYAKAQRLERSI